MGSGSHFEPATSVYLCPAYVTGRTALPRNRAETTIGSQAGFEITNYISIRIPIFR